MFQIDLMFGLIAKSYVGKSCNVLHDFQENLTWSYAGRLQGLDLYIL